MIIFAFILLAFQNIAIFAQHYFAHAGFPHDFLLSYYTVPYFWISAVSQGVFPWWVAQQAMGYPLLMNLQSGFFYPVLWFFVLFHQVYTLYAAVMIQCLHVLLGSMGMYFFLSAEKISKPYALLGAMVYQFFGGFYTNAEHVDIIRGYALTPWLLLGVVTDNKILAIFLIPFSIYLFFTGAYMGQSLAMLFILACFVFFQKKQYLYYYGLMLLGILLSSAFILPVSLFKAELARSTDYQTMTHNYFTFKNFFTSFLWANANSLPQDISMTSMFITLPIVGMLFFLTRQILKENKKYVYLLILSIIMITHNIISKAILTVFPPLALSRFPCADYRAYIAIVLIYFSLISLKNYYYNQYNQKNNNFKIILLIITVILGIYFLSPFEKKMPQLGLSPVVLLILCAVSVVGFIFWLKQKNKSLILFGLLIFLDGCRVWQGDHFLWHTSNIVHVYQEKYHINLLDLPALSFRPLPFRPARTGKPLEYENLLTGYLQNHFLISDYGGGQLLKKQQLIQADPTSLAFMQQPSQFLLNNKNNQISLISYANNQIIYNVDLQYPDRLLENEMYFPGWQGIIAVKNQPVSHIQAFCFQHGLRAWHLPAGQYRLVTYFDMPYLALSFTISAVALCFWIMLLLAELIRRRV